MKRQKAKKYYQTLEYRLCEILMQYNGERGHNEGAEDCLLRIVHERKLAMEKLAILAMNEKFQIKFF